MSEAGADQIKPRVEEPQRSVLGRLASWLKGFVRPPRSRPRGLAFRPTKRRLSLLTLKVIGFNFLALLVFGAGIYWLQEIRVSLVDERVKSLRTQAEIVAAALARYGAVGEIDSETATELDDLKAARVLNGLVAPTGMRARVFDRSGRPIQDTRFILSRNQVQARELPPPGQIDLIDELQSGLRSGLYQLRAGKEIAQAQRDGVDIRTLPPSAH